MPIPSGAGRRCCQRGRRRVVDGEIAKRVWAEADLLHSAAAVERALERMAEEITAELADAEPVVLCVMIGGLVTAGRLLPKLRFPLEVDYIHATRYRGNTRGAGLQWLARPQIDLSGRTVLLVDDILDEGWTLAAIIDDCYGAGAERVQSAMLLEKQHDRKADVEADYVGLQVADRYVFGCGMDYKGYLRNADGIYAVRGL